MHKNNNKPIINRKRARYQRPHTNPSFTRQKGHGFYSHVFALCRKYKVNFKTAATILKFGALAVVGRERLVKMRRLAGKAHHKNLGSAVGSCSHIPGFNASDI